MQVTEDGVVHQSETVMQTDDLTEQSSKRRSNRTPIFSEKFKEWKENLTRRKEHKTLSSCLKVLSLKLLSLN